MNSINILELPNNYYYINIDENKFDIKKIFKLLSQIIKNNIVKCKTVITITGKYGERGYSFTSDNYDKYSFHITDQYFPCHVKIKNCTDISQRLRIQGKYNDNPNLTLWTTKILRDIMEKFYIRFMKNIEKEIMNCVSYEEIRDLIEGLIDTSEEGYLNYMKYIGPVKYKKNIKIVKKYNKNYKGYRLIKYDSVTEENIINWCNTYNLPPYLCINEIKNDLSENEYIKKYGDTEIKIEFIPIDEENISQEYIKNIIKNLIIKYHKKITIQESC